ncbi:transcriptional regulator [Siminovitchia terrae]|uniref:Transcriptional regulator n=1 Tax=Siminovitchia terrae TaxID=1914933 RepID=A0A429X9F4_SIMTE|nr:helix-turn-helix transcriptional regulator [Siminovitchia terrae]RST59891.1 transcriptional regulator [Siminovitchia terrae]GIN91932.1 transcriptional regulator [Siminovitchia terrae]GIN99096.1 transcriptional regulator [Siminovitchia terrae]
MKNNIQRLRKAKKLSQEDLANLCQVTRQTINAIENNKYDPTLKLAFDMASVLDTTVDELFLYENEKNSKEK